MTMIDDEDDDDRVGYGRPPKGSRFKPGQSGNPSGRKRRHRPDEEKNPLRAFLLEEQTVKMAGKKVKMAAIKVIAKSIVNKAMAGDYRSQKLILEQCGGFKAVGEEAERQMNSADEAFIDAVRKEAKEWLMPDAQPRSDWPRDDG
jgi:hypothetical protein